MEGPGSEHLLSPVPPPRLKEGLLHPERRYFAVPGFQISLPKHSYLKKEIIDNETIDLKMELDSIWHRPQWPWVQTLGVSLSVPREFNLLLKEPISSPHHLCFKKKRAGEQSLAPGKDQLTGLWHQPIFRKSLLLWNMMPRNISGSKKEISPIKDFLQPFNENPEQPFLLSFFLYIYLVPPSPMENQYFLIVNCWLNI